MNKETNNISYESKNDYVNTGLTKFPTPISISFWIDDVFYYKSFTKTKWLEWFGWKSDVTFFCPCREKTVHAVSARGTLLPIMLFTIKFDKR